MAHKVAEIWRIRFREIRMAFNNITHANLITSNRYYVYAHINPLTKKIFYIGKGKGKRAFETTDRPADWRKLYLALKRKGQLFTVTMIASNLRNNEALRIENEWIHKLSSRTKLVNERAQLLAASKRMIFADAVSFGDFVRVRRIQRGLTQTKLGKMAKVPQTTISKIELDRLSIRIDTAAKVLCALRAQMSFRDL